MKNDLQDKHVAITGGAGALGSAVVEHLLERGAICHIPNYTPVDTDRFPHQKNPRVEVTDGIDLRDESAVIEYFGSLPALWGSAHIAGGFAMSPIAETSLADFDRMMQMNATTCFLSSREAVRSMRKASVGGRIVNVAAKPALMPVGGMIAYSASKAAVASITQSLGEELKEEGIFVNAIVPSVMNTPANRAGMPDADHGKWPSVDHVASTVAFLLSPANQATRSALVPVYGQT